MNEIPAPGTMESQRKRSRWVLIGFLTIIAFFLVSEHRAHLLGILPYLLVLACPLMHFFHHHGRHRNAPGPVASPGKAAPSEAAEHLGDRP